LAKIVAYNSIGDSVESPVGNGALLKLSLVPDAPILNQNIASSTKTQIGVTWVDGVYSGGQPVEDYRLSYDQGTNGLSFITVASGILTKSYTLTGLISGNTYKIRLESRNSIGYSSYSNEVTAIAAIVPSAPSAPSTIRDVNNIIIDWSAPTQDSLTAYGSAISGYKVFIRWQDGTYSEEETNCDGSDDVILANT
jgi:hypothetical protein